MVERGGAHAHANVVSADERGHREIVAKFDLLEPAVAEIVSPRMPLAEGYIARGMLCGYAASAKVARSAAVDSLRDSALMTAIKVPPLGESIVEATVSRWLKKEGDAVAAGDTLVELETDKITVEVPALSGGRAGASAR